MGSGNPRLGEDLKCKQVLWDIKEEDERQSHQF